MAAPLSALAQNHFSDCAARTGTNATIFVPDTTKVRVGDAALEAGDEIAVFTAEGHCAGVVTWTGQNAALTAWGDDPMTEAADGLTADAPLRFRIWDASEGTEYNQHNSRVTATFASNRPYLTTTGRYVPDGIYVLDTLVIVPSAGQAAWE